MRTREQSRRIIGVLNEVGEAGLTVTSDTARPCDLSRTRERSIAFGDVMIYLGNETGIQRVDELARSLGGTSIIGVNEEGVPVDENNQPLTGAGITIVRFGGSATPFAHEVAQSASNHAEQLLIKAHLPVVVSPQPYIQRHS